MGPVSREAVDRHMQAVAEHLAAVMWECAFAIVRSAQHEVAAPEPPSMTESVEKLVRTLHGEADRLTRELTALRARSAPEDQPRPPLHPVAEPPPRRPRRASMRESGLGALFQRTEDPDEDGDPGRDAPPPVALVPSPAPPSGGNPRLIELARSVERRAAGPWLQGA